jgi:hypothetical protein
VMSTDGVGDQGRMVNSTPMKILWFWVSSHAKTLPKKLIAPLSGAEPTAGNGSKGTCSRRRCARSTGDGNVEEQ